MELCSTDSDRINCSRIRADLNALAETLTAYCRLHVLQKLCHYIYPPTPHSSTLPLLNGMHSPSLSFLIYFPRPHLWLPLKNEFTSLTFYPWTSESFTDIILSLWGRPHHSSLLTVLILPKLVYGSASLRNPSKFDYIHNAGQLVLSAPSHLVFCIETGFHYPSLISVHFFVLKPILVSSNSHIINYFILHKFSLTSLDPFSTQFPSLTLLFSFCLFFISVLFHLCPSLLSCPYLQTTRRH